MFKALALHVSIISALEGGSDGSISENSPTTEMLIGLWQGGSVNAPGLIIGWDSALANSQAVQATGKDPVDWAFDRFYAWAHELAHEDDLSDRWLANRAVCRVRGRSSAAPDSYREQLA